MSICAQVLKIDQLMCVRQKDGLFSSNCDVSDKCRFRIALLLLAHIKDMYHVISVWFLSKISNLISVAWVVIITTNLVIPPASSSNLLKTDFLGSSLLTDLSLSFSEAFVGWNGWGSDLLSLPCGKVIEMGCSL